MSAKIEWEGVLDNLDCDEEAARAAGIDTTRWPARVEELADGSAILVIAADGIVDYSQGVRPSRFRDMDPPPSEPILARLRKAGEID